MATHAPACTRLHAPHRVTAPHPFFSCNSTGDTLFSVRPNVPLDDALDVASCLLASALSAVEQVAMSVGGDQIYGASKPAPSPDLSVLLARLEDCATASRKQADKEGDYSQAFHQGRASAFNQIATELREVAK